MRRIGFRVQACLSLVLLVALALSLSAPALASEQSTPEPTYAEGIHCTIDGQSRVPVAGETELHCLAEEVEGFVFDHWQIDDDADYLSGPEATFRVGRGCVVRACYHERRVLRTVNCYFQFLSPSNNASGLRYTEFDFETVYTSPLTRSLCPAGLLSCYVTADLPRDAQVDYWLINGVKVQFPGHNVTKFRLLDLDRAATIEPVYQAKADDDDDWSAVTREMEHPTGPLRLRCTRCAAQFMNVGKKPTGPEYAEFDFSEDYIDPVTNQLRPGGQLDIFLTAQVPRGQRVDAWIVNDVWFQFPQAVTKIRILGLREDTAVEVRFRG